VVEQPHRLEEVGRTKICCTLGPNTYSVEALVKLLRAGMSIARINMSYLDENNSLFDLIVRNLEEAC
jgi:pyruvate kinase